MKTQKWMKNQNFFLSNMKTTCISWERLSCTESCTSVDDERSFKHLTSKSPLSLNWIELKLCLALYLCFYKHHSNSTAHNPAKFVRINYELGINLNKLLLNESVMWVLERITWIISFFSSFVYYRLLCVFTVEFSMINSIFFM